MSVECSQLLDGFDPGDKRFGEFLVSEIAEKVYLEEITDDNPSPTSGRTSLEEILRYHFHVEDELTLENLLDCVHSRASKFKDTEFTDIELITETSLNMEEKLHPDEEQLRSHLINEIADQVCKGRISDDNPSSINGYTTLDQILRYHFELGEDSEEELISLRRRVQRRLKDKNSGIV